ncbi:porin [Sinomicrobium oceani]|uniref:porin n=1 Tax=Sinomicrobium oceani TaxID=1150368 RepID=UPI00227C7AAD|nr:porin [Sinomicrobium oceani]
MKTIKKLLVISILMVPLFGAAQIYLDKYNFGEGLNFSGEKGYKMRLEGFIQPYMETKRYTGTDDSELYNRFRMRRLRMQLSGSLADEKLSYRLRLDLSGTSEADLDEANSNILLDAYIRYSIDDNLSVTFGQKSTPTDNRELNINSQTLQLPERSRITSVFSTIREFGVFLDGTYRITPGGMYLRPAVAITNGDGQNAFKKDYGGLKYGGRLDFLPFGLFSNFGQFREADIVRERTPKLVVGMNYSYNDGVSSRRGRNSGSILYLNDRNEEELPDYIKLGVDFMFKYQGFSMLGEYVKGSAKVSKDITQRVRNDGSVSSGFEIDGQQHVANYIKNRMMLGEGYNIQAGYIFTNLISVDARYTHLRADKYSFMNNGTFYNRPNYYTIGVSKYLSRNYGAKIQASFTYVDAAPGSNDNAGNPIDGNEWVGRLILTIGF